MCFGVTHNPSGMQPAHLSMSEHEIQCSVRQLAVTHPQAEQLVQAGHCGQHFLQQLQSYTVEPHME